MHHIVRAKLWVGIALAVTLGAAQADARTAEEDRVLQSLHVALDGCVETLVTGRQAAFQGLAPQGGRTWRGLDGALEVSLAKGGSGNDVCRVGYSPAEPWPTLIQRVGAYREKIEAAMMAHPNAEVDVANVGRVIVTCVQGKALGLFFDTEKQRRGFAAQVAFAPPGRIDCGA